MRSAKQISSTVSEWHDAQRREREAHLAILTGMLRRARETHEPWYEWVLARSRGEHLHGAMDERGRTVACPSCDAMCGTSNPHRL
jgi:hypothetical protein